MLPNLSIIIPIYNEEKNVLIFLERLRSILQKMAITYEILFCLDPCTDNTEVLIHEQIAKHHSITLLKFSRRFGQAAATIAGLHHCLGDAAIIIDADLQDPPEMIPALLAKMHDGFDVVYAQRNTRKGETWFKKMFAYTGYSVINYCTDNSIPRNTGDFRILTRRVIDHIKLLPESHGFLRGLVAFVGFKQIALNYDRDGRHAGLTHYNRYWGSIKLGLNGLICFSQKPLQLITWLGLTIIVSSLFFTITSIFNFHFFNLKPQMILLLFLSGLQFLSMGIMGEYISRIYDEVKKRPMYIIDRIYQSKNK